MRGILCIFVAKKAPFFVKQRLLWTVLQTLGCENENQAPKHRLSDDDVKHLNKHLKGNILLTLFFHVLLFLLNFI